MDAHDVRKLINHLGRLATAGERIADALEKANEADPILAIERALSEKPDQVDQPDQSDPNAWRFR